ncbi:MAG: hypothetical protein R3C17_16040 [Planctomycetaceae bacterium]
MSSSLLHGRFAHGSLRGGWPLHMTRRDDFAHRLETEILDDDEANQNRCNAINVLIGNGMYRSFALAAMDVDHHALAIIVSDLQMEAFIHAKSERMTPSRSRRPWHCPVVIDDLMNCSMVSSTSGSDFHIFDSHLIFSVSQSRLHVRV